MISFSAVLRHSVVLLSISVLCTNGYAQNALPPTKYVQQTTSWVGTIQPVSSPLALGGTPSNNTCDQAVVEPLAPGSDVVRTGDNTGATDEIGLGVPQVWEAFTTTECMDVTVSYCGTDPVFQGALTQLYMGCPYGNLVRTGSGNVSQEACGDGNFSILFPQLPPDTYFYAVLGGAGSEGAYTLTFSGTACTGAPPTNNDCPGAVVLTPGTDCITVGADVLGANISGPSLPSITCGGFTGNASEDVWFSFVATAEEHVISVDGSDGFDAVIDLRDGSCANSNNIACQDGVSAGGVEVLNATNLTIGATYFIRVYDWYAGLPLTTTFDICVQGGPVEPCAADAGT
ncbi:MAG: hypothetical protein KDB84_04810, partial [Flavobacteriales bacterium]|nr:hypothetical protein [Flavobacteriales bacterium]